MKIRNGFVSNSSSSSFIVSHKNMDDLKIKVEIDLRELYSTKTVKTPEELKKFLLHTNYFDDWEEAMEQSDGSIQEEYDEYLKDIENGNFVTYLEFSTEEYGEEAFLAERELTQEMFENKVEIRKSY